VVLGDSLAFLAGTKALDPADLRLYPHVVGEILQTRTGRPWDVHVEVRAGWSILTLQRALRAARPDSDLVRRLAAAEAIVIGVGTMDATPAALPGRIGFGVRDSDTVRNRVTSKRRKLAWKTFARIYPALINASGARFPHTPPAQLRASWLALAAGLRAVAPGAAICGVVPAAHRCALYARSMRHHPAAVEVSTTVAAELGIPLVDLPALVGDEIERLPDGIHFTFELHHRVASAFADLVVAALTTPPGH